MGQRTQRTVCRKNCAKRGGSQPFGLELGHGHDFAVADLSYFEQVIVARKKLIQRLVSTTTRISELS